MADNAPAKRPRYFRSQFLVLRDFEDEQTYHAEMLRRHNAGLHSWGVVKDGLQVHWGGLGPGVYPGLAIDSLGREIVVEKGGTVFFLKSNGEQLKMTWNEGESSFDAPLAEVQAAATATGNKTEVYLTITFQEVLSDDPEDKYPPTGQQTDVTRYKQAPLLQVVASPPTDGSSITLAKVTLDTGGKLSIIYNSARTLAGSFGPLFLTSGSVDNNKVHADNSPQFGIDYDVMMDALTIKARSKPATPGLDVTHLTIKRDTGNVGIGTSEPPAAKLHVGSGAIQVGTVGDFVTLIDNSITHWYQNEKNPRYTINRDLVASGWAGIGFAPPNQSIEKAGVAVGISSSSALGFYTSNGSALTERVRIDSTGNVGIGIMTPNAKLQVNGGADTSLIIGDRKTAGSVGLQFLGSGYKNAGLRFDGDNVIVEDASISYLPSTWYDSNPNDDALLNFIVRNGKVGIGITSPQAPLHVDGLIIADNGQISPPQQGQWGGQGDRLILWDGGDGSYPYSLGIDSNNLWYSVPTGAQHSWYLGGTEMLRIDSSGKVGIGTTAPGAKLSVVGDPATVNVETKEIVRLVRSAVTNVKNQNSAGFLVGAFEQGLVGRSRLDIALAGTPTANNQWGGLPDTTVMSMLANGNVGIGTTSPQRMLEIGSDVNGIGLEPSDASPNAGYIRFGDSTGWKLHIGRSREGSGWGLNKSTQGVLMTIQDNGLIGIGTISPSKAKLEVNGSINTQVNGFGYLNKGGAGSTGNSYSSDYSIWASNRIAATEINAYSDQRIKNIQGRSDNATDLHTLLGIEITDYVFKDVIAKGNAPHKMVIGQQVERVFPQAVSKVTDVVPDIYRRASVSDGWVALSTDLKKGERVRLISDKAEGVYEVLEVTLDKFRTDFKPEGDEVFVFGREVNDFRMVDYDAIAMLNVSATQQLKKEKDEEVKALQAENAKLKARLDALEMVYQLN